jgi:folate-binding protein YgfZ
MIDSYGDVTAEYTALRDESGLVAGSHEIVWVRGVDAVSFLDDLLTQELGTADVGAVVRSLLLSPQGKLRGSLWVLRDRTACGLVSDAGIGATVIADLSRFRIRVDAEIDSEPTQMLTLWGRGAPAVVKTVLGTVPDGWVESDQVVVARADIAGRPRFFLSGVPASALETAGAHLAGSIAATTVRIESGEPAMGVDIDERTIPQESGLVETAVSFTKGCYLGQELVARIDSRGHVNRVLRGIMVAGNVVPPPGSELVMGDKTVGTLTSVGESLSLRAPVGMALVRREVESGDDVEIRWSGGSTAAAVRTLPMEVFAGA